MSDVIIFCDGASKGNPGPGGWGAVVATSDRVIELGGREERTTNNRMEITAAYDALRRARDLDPAHITIYTDSAYVIGGATKWGAGWRKRDWRTIAKEPVLNRDLWEPLLDLLDQLPASVQWENVGGHVGIPGNERVDEIASLFAVGESPRLYDGPRGAYPVDISHVRFDQALQEKKAATRERSRAKAYSYVSVVDGIVAVHKTWGECEARVRGKRARFKKALSPEDERAIIDEFTGSR